MNETGPLKMYSHFIPAFILTDCGIIASDWICRNTCMSKKP